MVNHFKIPLQLLINPYFCGKKYTENLKQPHPPFLQQLVTMAGREAIIQEFHNNEEHQNLLLHNVQPTGTFMPSGCGTYGKVEKVNLAQSYYYATN